MKTLSLKSELNKITTLTAILTAGVVFTNIASAEITAGPVKLLTPHFEPRQVEQVEVGDFHFLPGQVAPIHTHDAPAVGYVAKGEIIYQVEGERPQILREGDAFYEAAGPRILRFDNASATEEAIFLDFNLEQAGEPFIVFENPPTEAIDRRTLPSISLGGQTVDRVDIYSTELHPAGISKLNTVEPTLGLVAEGIVELKIKGQASQRIIAGGTFSIPSAASQTTISNASSEVQAKVITFRLL
jgi:quercetin dioxygenase-like cupin family protein